MSKKSKKWKLSQVRTIYQEQNGRCAGCQQPYPVNLLTRAHVIPYCAGGGRNRENIDLLCGPCHRERDGHAATLTAIGAKPGRGVFV